jgi:hypothetical protein
VRTRRGQLVGVGAGVVVLLASGSALAARSYADPAGDAGPGPDVRAVDVSNTATKVTFRVRLARTPPLRVDASKGWIDMLLIGIDVPPIGPPPVSPGGPWRGVDLWFGTHGRSKTGQLVEAPAMPGTDRASTRFPVVATGTTLRLTLPRSALGSATWFRFSVAAAREWGDGDEPAGAEPDIAPARGTFGYVLTG